MPAIEEKIKEKIEELRPGLQADGGDLELIEVDEANKRVRVKLHGACVGCPLSEITLRDYVLKNLKEVWPELEEVLPVQ
ncbi:NifU family protein [Candidatus Saccharibacteria bacterium]|nr:NifU family protein [Candidatus Saccharibacteria bacterium]NIV03595.1 NifU family protein [Calditrichia bacterium]NIS38142.1 NifU family protein [Candidatus Saccharibacteria bacterium]NIV71883.1 NifU family protein [Calditrichia bacterium]NIV98628.1 NifU family protein [Candidatus Saccharibacteria bacterium]